MNNHRYQFLYQPVIRFMQQLSPAERLLLTVLKIAFVVVLVGMHLASL